MICLALPGQLAQVSGAACELVGVEVLCLPDGSGLGQVAQVHHGNRSIRAEMAAEALGACQYSHWWMPWYRSSESCSRSCAADPPPTYTVFLRPCLPLAWPRGVEDTITKLVHSGLDTEENMVLLFGREGWDGWVGQAHNRVRMYVLSSPPPGSPAHASGFGRQPGSRPRPPSEKEKQQLEQLQRFTAMFNSMR